MIYFKTSDGKHVIILAPGNVMQMQLGIQSVSPDGEVVVAYSPDTEWTERQFQELFDRGIQLAAGDFEMILKEGLKRKVIS